MFTVNIMTILWHLNHYRAFMTPEVRWKISVKGDIMIIWEIYSIYCTQSVMDYIYRQHFSDKIPVIIMF